MKRTRIFTRQQFAKTAKRRRKTETEKISERESFTNTPPPKEEDLFSKREETHGN
jgi:hypothetical protein